MKQNNGAIINMSNDNGIKPVNVNASDTVFKLSNDAFEHAIGSVRVFGGPLIPFVITFINGEKSLTRYAANNIADTVKSAVDSIVPLPENIKAYAIAYDAILHIEGNKFDTIVVEVGERGSQFDYKFAQRYKPKKLFGKIEFLGRPMYLGEILSKLE